jgi:GTP-dependent phosphoenolpyruvate carboxykinase
MNEDSMNNQIIPIDQISSQQHLHVDNQKNQNSTQNYIKLKEVNSEIKQMKKSPMNPTPLYVSFFYLSIIIQIFH